MKRVVRRLIARVAPPVSSGGTRALLYHAVDAPDAADCLSLRVSRDAFRAQMTLLRDEGLSVVPLPALLDPPANGGRPRVAITFDDGYRSQAWAADVLREFDFPATFFVVPRFLDGVRSPRAYWEQWEHMGWDEAATLMADGFEIGAHSATHPDLRQCGREQLDEEVAGAKALLEWRLGREIVSFSYPYGRHDRRVRTAVKRAAFRLACTSRYGHTKASGSPYAIPRTEVAGTDRLVDFRWKLLGKYDWLAYWHDLKPIR